LLASLVGQGKVSGVVSSDGSGSGVEDKPLVLVSGVAGLNHESVLATANVCCSDKCFVGAHSGSDLESESVFEWGSRCVGSTLGEEPGLVVIVVARPPGGFLHVAVRSSPNVETEWSANHPDASLP